MILSWIVLDKISKEYDVLFHRQSDSKFWEVRFVSAVVAFNKEVGLVGFEFSEDLVSVKTGGKVLVEFLALLVFH